MYGCVRSSKESLELGNLRYSATPVITFRTTIPYQSPLATAPGSHEPETPSSVPHRHIRLLSLRFDKDLRVACLRHDWATLADTVSRFTALHHVVFVFGDVKGMEAFIEAQREMLVRIAGTAGGLLLKLFHVKRTPSRTTWGESTWYVEFDMAEMSPTGKCGQCLLRFFRSH